MSMQKAFTLSELIIALGIVGVISALCIPPLSDNIEKTRTASILGKVIKQVETGVANYMADDADETGASAETLLGTSNVTNFMAPVSGVLPKYIGAVAPETQERYKVCEYESSTCETLNTNFMSTYKFNKIPAELWAIKLIENSSNVLEDNKDTVIKTIKVDVNGFNKKPNQYGKDVFIIKILNDGRVVPNGEASDCTKDNIGDGKSCAARIVADKYKITYR